MRLNNRKIDLLLKLVMYFLPLVYVLIISIGTKATSWDSSVVSSMFGSLFLGMSDGFFSDAILWIRTYLTYNVPILDLVTIYMFYVLLVEMLILFKNFMIWIIRFANDFLERGLNND